MKVKLIRDREVWCNGEYVTIKKGSELTAVKGMEADARDVLNTPEGMCYLCEYEDNMVYIPVCCCVITETMDWEQRRYEIAKDVMCANICAPVIPGIDPNPSFEAAARHACAFADALILELKKGGK